MELILRKQVQTENTSPEANSAAEAESIDQRAREIMEQFEDSSDEYEDYCDAEREGEISREVFYRIFEILNVSESRARSWLRENYQRAGISHLF